MNVGHSVITGGGIFLMAKFDQMKQSKPFSVLAEAFEQYCDVLVCQQDSDWAKLVVTEFHSVIGRGICDLAKVIPNLGVLMNIGTQTQHEQSVENQNVVMPYRDSITCFASLSKSSPHIRLPHWSSVLMICSGLTMPRLQCWVGS
jgi:hypothetical protein